MLDEYHLFKLTYIYIGVIQNLLKHNLVHTEEGKKKHKFRDKYLEKEILFIEIYTYKTKLHRTVTLSG